MKVDSINVTADGVKMTLKLDDFLNKCRDGKVDGVLGYKEDKSFVNMRFVNNRVYKERPRVVPKKSKNVIVRSFDADLRTSFVHMKDIVFVFDVLINGQANNISLISRNYLLNEITVGQLVDTKLVGKNIDKNNILCLVQVTEYSEGTEFTRFAVIELHVTRDGIIRSRLLGNMSDASSFEDGRVYAMYNGQHLKYDNIDFAVNNNYCLLNFKADLGDRVMDQSLYVKRKRW